jgi:hypothetical protein
MKVSKSISPVLIATVRQRFKSRFTLIRVRDPAQGIHQASQGKDFILDGGIKHD